MRRKCFTAFIALVTLAGAAAPGYAAVFGTVTAIGGEAADIALDEVHGLLYVANFTGARIDVVSTADNTIGRSIPVSPWPGSLALSPDGQYLLIAHYGQGLTRPGDFSGLTLIHLTDNTRQTFATGDPPLGVSFFNNQTSGPGKALVVTTTSIYTFDPTNAVLSLVSPISGLSQALPVPDPKWPSEILQTACTPSGDKFSIWCVANASIGTGPFAVFIFDSRIGNITGGGIISVPTLQPRVSVSTDGSYAMVGHLLLSHAYWPAWQLVMMGRYPNALGSTKVTGHAVDTKNNLIYAQIPDVTQPGPPNTSSNPSAGTTSPAVLPTLLVMDADNLTVRDRILIPQNMVGRALLNAAGSTMYAISDSGIMVLPVGSLNQLHRLVAAQEDILVQTSFCDRSTATQNLTITDPGGGHTDFTLTSNVAGVTIVPSSGTTPATVQVIVDPNVFETLGTNVATLTLTSNSAVNVPRSVRLLVSNPDQNQRGSIVDVPGVLTDILPDPARNRYYIARQDLNQLLIFDGASNQKIAGTPLRTATTPTMMSFTKDQKYLVVGHDNSQLVTVYDLDKMQQMPPVLMPFGHYARSIAQSNGDFLAVVRNEGTLCPPPNPSATGCVDIIDFTQRSQPPGLPFRTASPPMSLGVFTNIVSPNSVVTSSPSLSSILLAEPDGSVMLYSADNNTYQSRKDLTSLGGAYAASDFNSYVIGNNIFDRSLVPIGTMDASVGTTAGFAFTGQGGYRMTAQTAKGPGVIQNLTVLTSSLVQPVPILEAPLLPTTTQAFTRTVAPMPSAGTVIGLTVSGITVLSANYAAPTAPPAISKVVSGADGTPGVAPGGIISIYGSNMSPTNAATSQIPLPTAINQSCLVVNGTPIPLLFVSPGQVNAQLPFSVSGNATMSIHTPAGISDNLNFTIQSNAPSIFMSATAGPQTGLATVFRYENAQLVTPTNPVRSNDTITIYLTGLGTTYPPVDAGQATPIGLLSWASLQPNITLGGTPLVVQYAGLVPGYLSGLYQINATVPGLGVPQGMSIPLVITQDGGSTTLNVRFVK